MSSVRVEKSYTRVINTLAELEAMSSIGAGPGASACLARLQLRLDRYLALTEHLPSAQPLMTPELIHALLGRVKEAIATGGRAGVSSAAADLRDQLAAHFRGLQEDLPAPGP